MTGASPLLRPRPSSLSSDLGSDIHNFLSRTRKNLINRIPPLSKERLYIILSLIFITTSFTTYLLLAQDSETFRYHETIIGSPATLTVTGKVSSATEAPTAGGIGEGQGIYDVSYSDARFSYLFYATNYDYMCSALVNIDRLLNDPVLRTRHRIGIYLSTELNEAAEKEIVPHVLKLVTETAGKVFLIRAAPPMDKLKKPMPHYAEVLLKLVAFDIGTRDASRFYVPPPALETEVPTANRRSSPWPRRISRAIILDSDQLITRNLDHLFYLPVDFDVAAPRHYWSHNHHKSPMGVTSTLMVIAPSPRLWMRMQDAMGTLKEGEYDMDLLNREFGAEALTLPARYCTLNSHWEVADLPFWFDMDREKVLLGEKDSDQGEDGAWGSLEPARPPPAPGRAWGPDEKLTYPGNGSVRIGGKGEPDPHVLLRRTAEVVHFTALGKPWSYSIDELEESRPEAHWVFAQLWGEWREAALKVCPRWNYRHGAEV